MALIDELKLRHGMKQAELEELVKREEEIGNQLLDLDRAIAALEAPAQPLDELRPAPGAVEEVRDQSQAVEIPDGFLRSYNGTCEAPSGTEVEYVYEDGVRGYGMAQNGWIGHPVRTKMLPADLPIIAYRVISDADDWTPTVQPAEMEGEPGGGVYAEPEIPEGFTKWEGVSLNPTGVPEDLDHDTTVDVLYRDGDRPFKLTGALAGALDWLHRVTATNSDIIAYRIIEAPAPEQFTASDFDTLTIPGDPALTQDVIDALIEAPEQAEPATDLWQQGYNDKLNGYEPSLAEPEYTKGYEARALIEREHNETMERAKFFEGGMMADADRHQSDQRSIVEKIGGVLGFKQKEPA